MSQWTEHTHRFEQPMYLPEPPRRSGPGKGAVTGILAGALLMGGLAGVAGAAGYDYVDGGFDDAPASSAPTEERTSTPVSDSEDTPAEAGSVQEVAASVLPSVVKINVTGPGGQGSGSGAILSEDGEILTNIHVVDAAAQGGRIAVSFDDGSTAPAEVVGTDPLTDLAVIRAEGVSGLTPATIGSSEQLDVGEMVGAVGSPFGLEATVTSGIVSALQRPVSVGGQGGLATTYPAIQTDAAINPGNSGGPLLNMRGEVVGVNSSIRSVTGGAGQAGSIGLGFAIPISNVLPIVDQLRNGETPTHARLGVTVADATSEDGLLSGAGLRTVEPGSAADEAGLAPGDVVIRIDDEPVSGFQSLVATIRGYRPGDTVTLTVVRDGEGESEEVAVTLDSDEGRLTS